MGCCKCGFFFQWPALLLLLVNIGDYFRADDSVDQSPGNLSSSSLRRKLFLDVNGSISDSLPSASPRSPPSSARGSLEVFSPMDLSPLHSSNRVQTPCAVRCGWLACHRCASMWTLKSHQEYSPRHDVCWEVSQFVCVIPADSSSVFRGR